MDPNSPHSRLYSLMTHYLRYHTPNQFLVKEDYVIECYQISFWLVHKLMRRNQASFLYAKFYSIKENREIVVSNTIALYQIGHFETKDRSEDNFLVLLVSNLKKRVSNFYDYYNKQ